MVPTLLTATMRPCIGGIGGWSGGDSVATNMSSRANLTQPLQGDEAGITNVFQPEAIDYAGYGE